MGFLKRIHRKIRKRSKKLKPLKKVKGSIKHKTKAVGKPVVRLAGKPIPKSDTAPSRFTLQQGLKIMQKVLHAPSMKQVGSMSPEEQKQFKAYSEKVNKIFEKDLMHLDPNSKAFEAEANKIKNMVGVYMGGTGSVKKTTQVKQLAVGPQAKADTVKKESAVNDQNKMMIGAFAVAAVGAGAYVLSRR